MLSIKKDTFSYDKETSNRQAHAEINIRYTCRRSSSNNPRGNRKTFETPLKEQSKGLNSFPFVEKKNICRKGNKIHTMENHILENEI